MKKQKFRVLLDTGKGEKTYLNGRTRQGYVRLLTRLKVASQIFENAVFELYDRTGGSFCARAEDLEPTTVFHMRVDQKNQGQGLMYEPRNLFTFSKDGYIQMGYIEVQLGVHKEMERIQFHMVKGKDKHPDAQ